MSDHLTAQQMLAYLDGELPRAQRHQAREHLQSCWTCRSETERLKADIAIILDAQREAFASALASPPRLWNTLEALIARRESTELLAGWSRLRAPLRSLLGSARVAAISTVFVLLAVIVYSTLPTGRVSAKEILRKMRTADLARTTIGSEQVIRQRIHILKRAGARGTPKIANVDIWRSPHATYWELPEGGSAAAELRAEYQSHGILEGLPFSALAIDSWAGMTRAQPTLGQQGTDMGLTYVGDSKGSNPLERVQIWIDPKTWHVLEMTLEFADASFEIREDDFAVMAASAVPSALLAHLEPGVASRTVPPRLVGTKIIRLPQHDIDKAELDVLSTLHRLKADLGEPVAVTHSAQGVHVTLWQLPRSRRDELRSALTGEPDVYLDLIPRRSSRRLISTLSETLDLPESAPESAVPDERLIKFFGSPEKRREFSKDILATSTLMLSHSYALRNLQEQFSIQRERALTPEQQGQLHQLINNHISAIASTLDSLGEQLAPLNETFHVAGDADSDFSSTPDWQQQTDHTLELARSIDHMLRAMLTTSETPASAETALPQISHNLAALRLGLISLNGEQH